MYHAARRAALACAVLLASCQPWDREEAAARGAAEEFLRGLLTCDFARASRLATESGEREVRWFASNLGEEDLSLVTSPPDIDILGSCVSDSAAAVDYRARGALVCDSLERPARLGELRGRVLLRRRGGAWRVDALEW